VEKTTPQGASRFDASKLPSIEKDGEAPFHMFFDIGVYGVSGVAKRGETWFAPDKVAAFEKYLIEIGGYSALYAIVELSEEDFCKMFDQELYSAMKTKWDPQNRLLDRYQKIRKAK
jgi:delta24-sterol reductase